MVDYDLDLNAHGLAGPRAALPEILDAARTRSLLDVGCGRGHWVAAACELGIVDVFGVDGASIKSEELLFPANLFQQCDLEAPFDLGRRFDVVLCLEVAEHLAASASSALVESLARHGDAIVFSAAVPGQPGQHHINCQWPEYWQELFNAVGYRCDDRIRWTLWRNTQVEPWYRQNMFIASRDMGAGREARLAPVLHPELLSRIQPESLASMQANWRHSVEHGGMTLGWYAKVAVKAPATKLLRKLRLS
jgi:SAM-dependent methyltransferase